MASEITRKGELSKNAILQAAYDLFANNGYHGTSMRQIASKADIALGGLYNHYQSKEQVFQAVLKEYHPYYEVFPVIKSVEAETIKQFVVEASNRMVVALNTRPRFMNLMFIEIVEFNNVHMVEMFSEFLPGSLELVNRLKRLEKDHLRELPSLMLIRLFLGMIFGYYLSEVILADEAPAEFRTNAIDYFTDVFLHGILSESERDGD
jgi:AcrR family transcriptional regulator